MSTNEVLILLGAFSASAVEMVEALTIVLGVGVVRGWRSTLIGVGIATIVLAALVAALGPALTYVPISTLRLVVGALLLAFGMQWLRKAILRSSGHKAMHDEDEAFRRERAEAAAAGREEMHSRSRSRASSSRGSRSSSSSSRSAAPRGGSAWPQPAPLLPSSS